jgi:N-acyl-D-amino-acid deacylase
MDAGGRIVAPGFIDAHTHDDRLLLDAPDMRPKLSQGVTTVIAGNCGVSLAPLVLGARPAPPPLDLVCDGHWCRFERFGDYVAALEAAPAATNAALLVGLSTLRVSTLDDLDRAANPAEVVRMRHQVQEALDAGAIGASTGLYYEPARAAPAGEVVEVCRPLTEAGGLYCTHLRDEADRVVEALDEAFSIGRTLGVGVVVSHHKVAGVRNHGRTRETLAMIEARARSQPVGLDCYPYHASSTSLSAERVAHAERTLITWSQSRPEFAGRDLDDVARELGVPPAEAVALLLPAGAIYFSMHEDDVRRVLAFAATMIGSDGLPHDAHPHPRLYGTFPRVIGHYVREVGLFPLEVAVHKMTGLTARTFGLAGRGLVAAGQYADLCIFDPLTVAEASSFAAPALPARGIEAVVVNGAVAWRAGAPTGARAGRVLRRNADGRSRR